MTLRPQDLAGGAITALFRPLMGKGIDLGPALQIELDLRGWSEIDPFAH